MKSFLFMFLMFFSLRSFSDSFCNIILQDTGDPVPLASLVGAPLTFERSLRYVVTNLPPGEIKDGFINDIKLYLKFDQSEVKNRNGIWARLKTSKIKKGKIFWNSITPKNDDQALNKVFKAVQLMEEQKAIPLGRFTVYLSQRGKYLQEFLEGAGQFISIQDALFTTASETSAIHMSSRAEVLIQRFKNIFLNLVWFRDYRGLRDLRLTTDLHKIAIDKDLLRKRLGRRYTPEITLFWYITHLRNIQYAATFALLAVLIPEVTGAYMHEENLERLEQSSLKTTDYSYAKSILTASETEVREMLKNSLKIKAGQLRPEEVQFLREVGSPFN